VLLVDCGDELIPNSAQESIVREIITTFTTPVILSCSDRTAHHISRAVDDALGAFLTLRAIGSPYGYLNRLLGVVIGTPDSALDGVGGVEDCFFNAVDDTLPIDSCQPMSNQLFTTPSK
jgi:hypothetical protein